MDQQNETGSVATNAAALPFDVADGRRRIGVIALAVSFIILFSALVQRGLVYLVHRYVPTVADADWYPVVLAMLPMYLIAMPLSLLLYRAVPAEAPASRRLPLRVLLGLLAVCFTLTYAGNFLGSFFNLLLGLLTGETPENAVQTLTAGTPLWANLLFCGILAPILEEIFYRKLVIDRLRVLGELPAVLLSGLLFGLIHGNFSQFFYATFVGFVLGYLYLRTGRLRYPIAIHMTLNLAGGVLMTEIARHLPFLMGEGDFALEELAASLPWVIAYGGYLLLLLACVVATPITLLLLRRQIRLRRADPAPEQTDWLRMLPGNPPVWLLGGVILLLFLA